MFTFRRPAALTTAVRELRIHGVEPQPQIVLESYAALPSFLIGTNRIALVQRRLAEKAPVRVLRCPVPLSPLLLALWWHPSRTADAGHQWLRRLFTDAEAAADRPA